MIIYTKKLKPPQRWFGVLWWWWLSSSSSSRRGAGCAVGGCWGDAGSSLSPLSVVVVVVVVVVSVVSVVVVVVVVLIAIVPLLAVPQVIPPHLTYQLSSLQAVAHGRGVWSVVVPAQLLPIPTPQAVACSGG